MKILNKIRMKTFEELTGQRVPRRIIPIMAERMEGIKKVVLKNRFL
jgi:hypothetical protein